MNVCSKLYNYTVLGVRFGLVVLSQCCILFGFMSLHMLPPCRHAFLPSCQLVYLSAYSSPVFVSTCFHVNFYLPVSLCTASLSRVCLSVCLFDCFSVCITVYVTPAVCLFPVSLHLCTVSAYFPPLQPPCLPGSVALFYRTRMLLHCAWTWVALSGNRWF